MLKVYKYEIKPGKSKLTLPKHARFLDVAAQGDRVFLWALVDTEKETKECTFLSVGTGHDITEVKRETQLLHVGTAHGVEGWMVWHVFEVM